MIKRTLNFMATALEAWRKRRLEKDEAAKVARAGKLLRELKKREGETGIGMRRQQAMQFGLECGLVIDDLGSRQNPNRLIEAIVAASGGTN